MTGQIRPDVNRAVFSWAVERIGMSAQEAVSRFPKFNEWREGKSLATVKQLKDFSRACRFPFGYFFLEKIPDTSGDQMPFFRASGGDLPEENLNVLETIAILRERQEWFSEYLSTHGAEKNPFVGRFRHETDADKIAAGIKEFLRLDDGWNLKENNAAAALKSLCATLAEENVIVTRNSIVGNNTSRPVPVSLCRGFCLVDSYAPFIFINSADSKNAQLFTLLHETAHVLISFSSGFGDMGAESPENPKEALCDKVAAQMLVPEELLREFAPLKTDRDLSNLFKASELVVLRRKLDCGLISQGKFFSAYNALPAFKKGAAGGGDFYRTAATRTNLKFLRCLDNAVREDLITTTEAYSLAGVKGGVFERLLAGEKA